MSQGLPPPPTCRHIAGGFLLFVILCVGALALPNVVKWVGAAFTFIPSSLGFVDVVSPREVKPVHMGENPTVVEFTQAGKYALFTLNYDFLVINDAVVAAHGKPWVRLAEPDGSELHVTLVERGMSPFDTPFAPGRPLVLFEVPRAGLYEMRHPTRDDFVYIVPDYTFGRETELTLWAVLQLVLLGGVGVHWARSRAIRNRPPTIPRPTAASRLDYLREREEKELGAMGLAPSEPRPWAASRGMRASENAGDTLVAPERDVLLRLRDGQISAAQAEAEIDAALTRNDPQAGTWHSQAGLSSSEAAAYSQGASVSELLRFRYTGWPDTCLKCGMGLKHEDLRWWFVRDDAGLPALRHIECPAPGRAA